MEIAYFLLSIIVIITSASLLGKVFSKLKQPALVGELLAGMILGPSLLGLIHTEQSFGIITSIAVFFLMLLAGFEMNLKEIKKVGKSAIIISLISFTIPFLLGTQVASAFGLPIVQSLFMGLVLSITAVPVSAIILREFGILKSKIGNTVMTSAILNDIFAIVVLGIILSLHVNSDSNTDVSTIGYSIAEVLIFIGVFFAGIILGKVFPNKESSRVCEKFSSLIFALFGPLFFGLMGIKFNISSIFEMIPLFVILLVAAIATKIAGGFIGAKITKFSNNDSFAIGALMNGRGMVGIAIASIGLTVGILDIGLFSIAIAIGFATTISAPLLARSSINKLKAVEKTNYAEKTEDQIEEKNNTTETALNEINVIS